MSEVMLDIRRVTVRYGGTVAVDNVSLAVKRGDFVSLLGPSGCGKTTLLRTIAGYVAPEDGEVFLAASDVTRKPPQQRNIGMVFQNYALFPHMTVAQNIAFPLKMRRMGSREIDRRVAEMLAAVHLPGLGERRPAQLSGGQQQRVALARALVFEPQLLLLDEPLGALDLRLRESMQVEIRRIQRDTGVTTVFVTHDQGEALAMSDFIVVMNKGRVEQIDPPRDLYGKPRTIFVADFVGRSNIIDVDLKKGTLLLAGIEVGRRPDLEEEVGSTKLAVRPEHVRLSRHDAPLRGRVESVVFMGIHSSVWLRLENGAMISAHVQDVWSVGEEASISWDPAHCRLLNA
jgi:spermidine/putrescine ABC transporter ATP-binding subunit